MTYSLYLCYTTCMIPNHSPWIQQLTRTRPVTPLHTKIHTDIAIVGGGIAGITTAYFILKYTHKRVVLLEADKVAHGATGHNAGQIASYFERPLTDLVREFGVDLAIDGQKSIESAWALLDEIIYESKLQVPVYKFMGYAGLSSLDGVLLHLQNNRYRVNGGLQPETILIAKEWQDLRIIPDTYKDLYSIVPQKDLMTLLETNNQDYIACLSYTKGCMNSALFSEELLGYIIATYPDRFHLYEGSPVKEVILRQQNADLHVRDQTVTTERVVLCTNGFENFTLINTSGPDIDTSFHHLVNGRIGYMSGYFEPMNRPPIAISYFPHTEKSSGDPTGENYFYLTRRPHEHKGENTYTLVCTGGPEKVLPNGASYSRHDFHSEETKYIIDDFLSNNYEQYPSTKVDYAFSWHGLMGYTPNGVRCIGPEPINPTLLYNLGCNGVGILPSIFGAKRISQFIHNDLMSRSIFDPKDQR